MKRGLIASILLGAFLATPLLATQAQAQEKLYYLGGYLGYALENLDDGSVTEEFRNPIGVAFENTFGVQTRAGIMLKEYLAAEVMIEYLAPFEDTSEGKTAEISVIGAGVNLKAALIYLGDLEPYGLVGLGLMYADQTVAFEDEESSGTSWGLGSRLGLGLEYRLGPEMSVGGELAFVKGLADTDHVSYIDLSAGVLYRF